MPDLTTYTWRQLSPATHPVSQFGTMCWAGTKAVFFGDLVDETWVLEDEEWRQLAPATSPGVRHYPDMAWDGTRVLLFGGCNADGDTFYLDTWSLDLGTEEWTQLFPTHNPVTTTAFGLSTRSMIWDGSRFIKQIQILSGGNLVPQTWKYESADWTNVAPAHQPAANTAQGRCFPGMTFGGGVLTMFGGVQAGSIDPVIDQAGGGPGVFGATWDFESGDWTLNTEGSWPNVFPHSASPHTDYTRSKVPIASTGTETLLFGGSMYHTGFGIDQVEDDTWMLDAGGWAELVQSTHPVGLEEHSLVYDTVNERFFLWGGSNPSSGGSEETWVFEGPQPPPEFSVASIRTVFGLGE